MAEIDVKCCICEASFRAGSLDKAGKCPGCAKDYPDSKNKLEAMAKNQPKILMGNELTEERVRKIIQEEFNTLRMQERMEKARKVKETKKDDSGDKE